MKKRRKFITWSEQQSLEDEKILPNLLDCPDCRMQVLAIQGKSKRSQLWDIKTLLESNGQLRVIDPKIAASMENYRIKQLDSELNARFIVLT
ncbi:hypothetical protein LSH36_427g06028 [Paralvinella palmiformis]|uniref:Uncharacterized protein n=1 Tax=Paralvinella palmiformis TaxID=53620 RepID=A0AAD9JBI9_9ANNE|nr:hypothetical protein LSH36_427g06028 [Paralvinella palmiformis]